MIDKTLALLSKIQPGIYVLDDTVCHDPAEIEALGRILKRLTYAPSSIRKL